MLAHLLITLDFDVAEVDRHPIFATFSRFVSNIVELCCELNVL